jgi:hypothetical protein
MKKTIIIAMFLIGLGSCKKSDITCNSNCGKIMADDVRDYSVLIKNSCTGNQKWFILQRGDWLTAYVGTDYCITNSGTW